MSQPPTGDFFDKARTVSVALLLAAATAAMAGTLLNWVEITRRVAPDPGAQFGTGGLEDVGQTEPFQGIDIRDGWIILGAALVLLVAAFRILSAGRGTGLAFLASIVIGAIAIADYRGIGDPTSAFSLRTDIGREAAPGIGLTLVAAAGFVGLLAAAAARAAIRRRDEEQEE